MKSQAKTIQTDSTCGSSFDSYYCGTEAEKPDLAVSSVSGRTTEALEPKPRYLGYERARHREEKARQVGWWIGRVECVYEDYFTAVLEDLKGRTSVAEFDKEEITPSDLNLLVPNVRFSFTVTQVDKRSGREYVSKISLSGPAIWTERDSKRARESYKKIFPEELLDF